jgi:succinate dehydrogenase / fumarate reductase, cytochrome b subunit
MTEQVNYTRDKNKPGSGNLWKWFDPRGRDMGTWAFILNRITALGLTLYLFLHLVVLGQLALGPQYYNRFLQLLHHPVVVALELLVVIAGIYHGLNGIRIGLTSFGVAVPNQKLMFWVVLALTILGSAFFAVRMFGG